MAIIWICLIVWVVALGSFMGRICYSWWNGKRPAKEEWISWMVWTLGLAVFVYYIPYLHAVLSQE